ncbi:hypothetical protein [Fluviispira multicolorata]|uniref:Lipocalin-like domain-containing protein n=1 Tax=Fluviispira multicolorata TaxID=2654512 RepID=A0A833N4I3_9BACT|nr:hypothetical protein [Fluviispira multicolorata]KAB8032031.1 hypothetical protein GCL57_05125 [Fluviispira multicolorata]
MKTFFTITLLSLLSAHSAFSQLVKQNTFENSDWSGTHCSPYADSILQGTYNYKFSNGNKIEGYLVYYTDMSCTTKTGYSENMTSGTYKILNSWHEGSNEVFNIQVKYDHLNYDLTFKVTLNENEMTLCRNSNRSCGKYLRIK